MTIEQIPQTNSGTWTDYIYANGQKIAMVASQKPQWHMHGQRNPAYNNMGCGVEGAASGVGNVNGIVVQAGDKFVVDVMQSGEPTYGGIALIFQDGFGSGALNDETTGTPFYFNGVADGQWHHMVGDMSQFAGETLSYVLAGIHNNAPAGTFDLWMANAVYLQADGTIASIFNGQSVSVANFSGSACGGYNLLADTETVAAAPAIAANYYVDDHLGTTQIELGPGGWPVWKGEFAPFGQEIGITQNDLGPQPADGTAMRYKFTGKERDAESGLDYFGARYYASSMGRWMSPDWADKPEAVPYSSLDNPQSLNLYGYVGNNPLSRADADGHCFPFCLALAGGGVLAEEAPLAAAGPVGWTVIGVTAVGVLGYAAYEHFHQDAPAPAAPIGATEPPRTANDALPRDKDGRPVPDAEAAGNPHTQLGTKDGRAGPYTQGREFDANGKPVKDIDHTDHGRPKDHTNPHEHPYRPGDGKRMPAQPVTPTPPPPPPPPTPKPPTT